MRLFLLKTFLLCSYHVFPHLFHETRCLVFLFFSFKEGFKLVAKLIPVPFFSLFICSCFQASRTERLLFLRFLCRSLTTNFSFLSSLRRALCSPQRFLFTFLSVLRVPKHLRSFALRCFPRVAATCLSWSRTIIYFSIFHFVAFFNTAVVFLTLDLFHLLSGEHEDDRDTLCMVLGSRGAAASHVSDHSLRHCSISSSSPEEKEGVCFSLTRHPFISLLIPLFLCMRCRTLTTEVNMHDFGVCFPPNGFTMASMIALLTTS